MLQYIEYLCEEELKEMDKINVDRKQLREELDTQIADNMRRRAQNAEQAKMLNQKVLQQRQEDDVSLND